MRSLWVSLSILTLIFVFALCTTGVIEKDIQKMEASLSRLEATGSESSEEEILHLEHIFRKRRWLYSISLPMEDIDSVENALIHLKSAQKNGDDAAYEAALCNLSVALYRLRDATIPSWETVF